MPERKETQRISFTDERIRKLPVPETGRENVFDTKIPPLCVRLSPNGGKAFYLYKRADVAGSPMFKIGNFPEMKVPEARGEAEIFLGKIRQGVSPTEEKRRKNNAGTLGNLWVEYLERHLKPNGKNTIQPQSLWRKDLARWKNRPLNSIRSRDIVELYDSILDRGSPQVANKVHALLSAMFRFGMRRAFPGLEYNPVSGREMPAAKAVRNRVLSEDEIRIFWHGLDQASMSLSTRQILRTALTSAQRIGEISSMSWSELDLEAREWIIPGERVKNRKTHLVPLNGLTLEIIKSMPRDSDYVFPGQGAGEPIDSSTPSKVLRRELIEGRFPGCEKFTAHDLRRSAATHVRSGNMRITTDMVGALLNHTKSGITAMHYDLHDNAEEKRLVAEAWNRKLTGILNPTPPAKVVNIR